MKLRFVIDAQLPPALADRLSGMGHAADHFARIGLGVATDAAIWAHATARQALLVTKDEDFVAMALRDRAGPQVVWVRIGNTTNDALWRVFEPALRELLPALQAGERIVEVV